MQWDYAELSKAAKEVGGPQKLVDFIFESGKNEGRKEMIPVIIVTALAAYGIPKLIAHFKKNKASPEEVEVAKAELIKGIEEYDASHPDENNKVSDSIEEEDEQKDQSNK